MKFKYLLFIVSNKKNIFFMYFPQIYSKLNMLLIIIYLNRYNIYIYSVCVCVTVKIYYYYYDYYYFLGVEIYYYLISNKMEKKRNFGFKLFFWLEKPKTPSSSSGYLQINTRVLGLLPINSNGMINCATSSLSCY